MLLKDFEFEFEFSRLPIDKKKATPNWMFTADVPHFSVWISHDTTKSNTLGVSVLARIHSNYIIFLKILNHNHNIWSKYNFGWSLF